VQYLKEEEEAAKMILKCEIIENEQLTNRWRNINERSVKLAFTSVESFEARVFGYMKGASDSTSRRSKEIKSSSSSLRTEFSDLSYK
jgi:hypothetical protein